MIKKRQLLIEKSAESVRDECSVTEYGIQNIFEVAEKIGYRVIRYPVDSNSLLGFALYRDSDRIVFSNSSQILSREVFSVAHEIGHHKLHITEEENTLIRDDNFFERDEREVEANYFAACLLMPQEKVEKYIRLEMNEKNASKWNGFEIARLQTAFNVSYEMTLIRLKALDIIDDSIHEKLKMDKVENTATKLLTAINGNLDLCRSTLAKKVPAEYLEWVISNYNEKLIPKASLEKALNFVDLNVDDFLNPEEMIVDDSIDDLLKGID